MLSSAHQPHGDVTEWHFLGTPSQLQPGWTQTELMQQLGTGTHWARK